MCVVFCMCVGVSVSVPVHFRACKHLPSTHAKVRQCLSSKGLTPHLTMCSTPGKKVPVPDDFFADFGFLERKSGGAGGAGGSKKDEPPATLEQTHAHADTSTAVKKAPRASAKDLPQV